MKTALLLLCLANLPALRSPRPPATQKPLSVGDVVYVHASNGLALRQTASKDGAKIALLDYNAAPLTVLALPDPTVRYVAEQFGSFTLAGGWVKVKTPTGQEGYLFEGYLSHYPPAIESPEQGRDAVEWFYQTISPLKSKRKTLPPQDGSIEHYVQEYADGVKFELEVYPGGSTQTLDLPAKKFTMQEALVLFRPVWFAKEQTTGKYDPTKQLLEITGISGYYLLRIQPKGNRLILRFLSAD